MPSETKTCRECEQNLSEKMFELAHGRWRRNICIPCRSKNRYSNKIKKLYSIDLNQKLKLEIEQGGVCAICARSVPTLCVDHNHTTGEVRGLLCSNCNTGLGLFGDNVQHLTQAIEYLRLTHSASPVR